MNTASSRIRPARQWLLILIALAGLGGCANFYSVQSTDFLSTTPHIVRNCEVHAVRANFAQLPTANDIPLKLGRQIATALTARGIRATYQESTFQEVADSLHSINKIPGTFLLVEGESVVIERNQWGGEAPNGITFYKVNAYDAMTGSLAATYKLRVATGPLNFKSKEGGFEDTANAFVRDCIDGKNQLIAPVR